MCNYMYKPKFALLLVTYVAFILGIKHDADVSTEANVDLTELLGIAGVPTFLFIHQEGRLYLAYIWTCWSVYTSSKQ